VQPGLHWNPPVVDEVSLVNVSELNAKTYENRAMLTTDENIIDIAVTVQYLIQDPVKYVIAVQDPELSLDNASESAIRHVVGGNFMDQILTTGRDRMAADVQERLQDYMNAYNTGIFVSQVNVVDAQPPDAVRPAFDDVIRAREDEQRVQNQAQQYSNQIIPEARGEAQRRIEAANAYSAEVVAEATGDASRFDQLLTEYLKSPEVTRQRLYIDSIEDVMTASSKIMVDVEGGNNMLFLPLDKLMEQSNSSIVVIVASNSLFVVKETERAVMLQFGELVQDSIDPGLHVKIPWVNNVRKFDARILTEDAPRRRYLTLEQKALEVDSYAKWRIVDVGQFYISTRGNTTTAGSLLAERINDGLRDQIGDRTLAEVVAGERDQMMLALTADLNETTAADLGIEIIDVRVKRIDLPEDVRSSVYERMITERNREAQELRSFGEELAIGIRADADRQATIFRAEAYRDAEQLRGEGDATATAIYANAYNKDPEFYAFTRSLNSYRETFSSKGDVLLLDPNSDYFKYLKNGISR
jgi:membrane protease subunit HflC